jgi:hypothetical protein
MPGLVGKEHLKMTKMPRGELLKRGKGEIVMD